MRPDLRRGLSVSDRERPLATGVNGPLMARQPRSASLDVLARMPVAQLDPVHETGARLLKRDRSCWKSGLRSARFTNAHCRRPSAPPRKMATDPVQHSDQPVPVRMSAFLRHISIMHLLSLGYEPYDMRLPRLGQSPVAALASADLRHEVVPGLPHLPRLSMSRRVSCTNACTNQPPGLLVHIGQHDSPIWRTVGTGASDP
jgi:hypothetical protein